jgi:hypothetical protein
MRGPFENANVGVIARCDANKQLRTSVGSSGYGTGGSMKLHVQLYCRMCIGVWKCDRESLGRRRSASELGGGGVDERAQRSTGLVD